MGVRNSVGAGGVLGGGEGEERNGVRNEAGPDGRIDKDRAGLQPLMVLNLDMRGEAMGDLHQRGDAGLEVGQDTRLP